MNLESLEKKIFSKKEKFKISKNQFLELKKNLHLSRILIVGAAGSIGKSFSLNLCKFKFKRLIMIDNNETGLTNLNRDINLSYPKKF